MKTRPEGFWWFRSGEYDDEKLRADLQERLPRFYGDRGYVDFQVLDDTLVVDDTTGKATLVVRVSEGEPYRVGTFEIVGNRRFSTEDLQQLFPFKGETRTGLLGLGGVHHGPAYFDQQKWDDATQQMRTLYYNNGYIYMQPRADVIRRTAADGKPVVDLRWVINEGQPAIVNKIEIVGNDVTHERVIREAIILLPGDVFRQDALLRSYQNISNLGFFQQPLPFPDTRGRHPVRRLGPAAARGGRRAVGLPRVPRPLPPPVPVLCDRRPDVHRRQRRRRQPELQQLPALDAWLLDHARHAHRPPVPHGGHPALDPPGPKPRGGPRGPRPPPGPSPRGAGPPPRGG